MAKKGDIKSDRIGNVPDGVNNTILTKGWLRIIYDDKMYPIHLPTAPKNEQKESEDILFRPHLSLKNEEDETKPPTNISQSPINNNDLYQNQLDANNNGGFLINPLFDVKSKHKVVPCSNCFYFRLSGLSIYFTQLKEDMTVVGQMSIKNIKDLEFEKQYPECIILSNFKVSWTICAASKPEAQEW